MTPGKTFAFSFLGALLASAIVSVVIVLLLKKMLPSAIREGFLAAVDKAEKDLTRAINNAVDGAIASIRGTLPSW